MSEAQKSAIRRLTGLAVSEKGAFEHGISLPITPAEWFDCMKRLEELLAK